MTKAKTEKTAAFEETLEHLEELVRELESGDKSLEDSLALFEKGIALARDLSKRLEEAKTKVSALSQENGKLVKKPFAADER